MSEIINLRQARKRAARVARETKATANRAHYGQSKAERAATDAGANAMRRTLDGARLQDPRGDGGTNR